MTSEERWAIAVQWSGLAWRFARSPQLADAGIEPDDAHQDMLIDIVNHAHHYNPEIGEIKPFLCLILSQSRGRLLRHANATKRQRHASLSDDLTGGWHKDNKAANPCEEVAAREEAACLDRARGCLTGRRASVIDGHYIENKSLRDIARELKVTRRRVYQWKDDGLRTLRIAMGAHCE